MGEIMKRIAITGVLGVVAFAVALIGLALGNDGSGPMPPPSLISVKPDPVATLEQQAGIKGTVTTATGSGPGKLVTVGTADGGTAAALSCTGTAHLTVITAPGGTETAGLMQTSGGGHGSVPCDQVGRQLAIDSGAPASVVAHFSSTSR
jgi:hypothetical protein